MRVRPALVALASIAIALPAACLAEGTAPLLASSTFFQPGAAEGPTDAVVFGLTWDWRWEKETALGTLTGYWEASLGRWSTETDGRRSSAFVTQLGVTPVLRLQPALASPGWFTEAGIGANLLLPVYRSKDKQFSTRFNFGDHIAIGRRFGEQGKHEVALRVEHFSNAGIRRPNPGENFLQLRYSVRF